MTRAPFGGFSVTPLGGNLAPHDLIVFTIEQDGDSLNMNSASYDVIRRRLTLITRLLSVEPKDAASLSDLAQLAAISLLLPDWPRVP